MMNKKLVSLLWILVTAVAMGQTKDIRIYWGSESSSNSVQRQNQRQSDSEKTLSLLSLTNTQQELSYDYRWQDQGYADGNSARIMNAQWEPMTSDEVRNINTELVPSQMSFTLSSSFARDLIYTTISISPVRKEQGNYQKLVSFQIQYRYTQAPRGNRMPITNSVLGTGDWYRFKIEKTGVYRLSKAFLEDIGLNTNGLNPDQLKVYGHGGKPLPLRNSENNQLDLPEVAIQVVGGEDGSFDSGDYVLFYGIGVAGYDEENDTNLNPYFDDTYYYVTTSGGTGLRIQPMVEPSGNPTLTVTSFQEAQFHEEDDYSPAKVGRQWFGNRFDIESEQSYQFTFDNLVGGETAFVRVRCGAASESSTSMAVTINSTSMDPLVFSPINDPTLLDLNQLEVDIPVSGESITVDLNYNNGGNPTSVGYLDYIYVEATRTLTGTGTQLQFYNREVVNQGGIAEYQLTNVSDYTQVWDVTNPQAIRSKPIDAGSNALSFKAEMGELRKYVAVHPNDYYSPQEVADSRVPNQDLKGSIFLDTSGNFQDLDYLIVAHPTLIQPALRLAQHHKNITGLNVKVVTTDKIYTEFSSGKLDIAAIRNFVRYIYENASDPSKRLKYLCLFGDASVDVKDRLTDNNNRVPTFHTVSSVNTFSSFMSDDFYGMMDFDEGTVQGSHSLDIAVGRIVVDEVPLANTVVDKILTYASKEAYGNWRNTFVVVSDDVDIHWEYKALEVTLDSIADRVSAEKPFINVKKIHSDAYQQETSAGGNRYPKVKEDIQNFIEVGALVVNYFGHGGEDGWSKEYFYTKDMASDLRNDSRYPCFVTVTCEFSKFDNPQRITAGELTFWNSQGGAASLITTTRSIGVSLGVTFNKLLSEIMFGLNLGDTPPPAESLRRTKNLLSANNNKRVVFYIGDPAMPLAFPERNIRLRTINDVPVGPTADTLKALSRIKMTGEVTDISGNLLTNYNGTLEVKVYDKDLQRETLANDGIRDNASDVDNDGDTNNLLKLQFKTLGEVLFSGQASISAGQFSFEFVVPRDTQIPVGNGKVSFYAQRDGALEDQTGYNLDILVGGLNENAPEDTQGPFINLFMNDESFVSGGITNDSPILIAKLEDENGINTSSGIGHDIVAILDGDEANPFVLNEYYQAEVDDYTQGKANYKLRDLEPGLHTLTVKAWDTYNNSNTAEIQFVVAGDDELKITRVLNYPNPFVNYTEFWFNHNRPMEPLEVQVQVFTVTGKVVWTQNQIINTDGFLSRDIIWNGKDDFGDAIGKGVYVYKLTVKSTVTGKRVEKFEKLVIL